MQQRLVAWGDIGTDHKALIAIEFIANEHKVIFRAIPEGVVDKEIQNNIFINWKNGGDFVFPDDVPTFDVQADSESLLPEGIKLHKPELLVAAQRQWIKIQELENNFKVLGEKLHVLELELDGITEFSQGLWNKTKQLWDDISQQKKDSHLGWAQADELKIRINSLFDGLKAFRRLNKEKNYDESSALFKLFQKQIGDCEEKLIYPDEWRKIFDTLKGIQKEMRSAPLLFKHQRTLINQIDGVFSDLRNYRKADQINHVQQRVHGLERVLRGIKQSIERDEKSYENQFEKMKHYTRGKMSDEDIASQLKHLKDQAKVKQKKIKSIEKTLRSLDNKVEALKNPPKPKPKPQKQKGKQKKQEKEGIEKAAIEKDSEAKSDSTIDQSGETPVTKPVDAEKIAKATAQPIKPTPEKAVENVETVEGTNKKTVAAQPEVEIEQVDSSAPIVEAESGEVAQLKEEKKAENITTDPSEQPEEVSVAKIEIQAEEVAAEEPQVENKEEVKEVAAEKEKVVEEATKKEVEDVVPELPAVEATPPSSDEKSEEEQNGTLEDAANDDAVKADNVEVELSADVAASEEKSTDENTTTETGEEAVAEAPAKKKAVAKKSKK